jgi:hypothetical protein
MHAAKSFATRGNILCQHRVSSGWGFSFTHNGAPVPTKPKPRPTYTGAHTLGQQNESFDAGADMLDIANALMWMQEVTRPENHVGGQAGRWDDGIQGVQG